MKNSMDENYLTEMPGRATVLREAIARGVLRCHVRGPLPARLAAEVGGPELLEQLEFALGEWLEQVAIWQVECGLDPRGVSVRSVEDENAADIVLGYDALTQSMDYVRAMTTGWSETGKTAYIFMDTEMRWHATESKLALWRSLTGLWRLPVRALLLHECGHALGMGHTLNTDSVMYAPAGEFGRKPTLHTRSHVTLNVADRYAFRDYLSRVMAQARPVATSWT